ncbi:Tocp1 variant tocp4 [Theileria orientalis]|uniref:Tocp1 variant tocp4 n=1 Tax=Theileria orientalis TaxID=68886 RepID=A0A976MBP5_THEOR|nr:Tocp1 variant tocp4 [Theileria orientalis]
MADAVLSNPNQRLVSNRFDDVECHNQSSDIEIPSSSFKTILRKRKIIIVSTLSLILLAVTATVLSAVFIVKANQAKAFKKDLEALLDKDFNFLEAELREKYVDDMVTLFKKGYVSSDCALEFETYLEFGKYNEKYSVKHVDEKERRERFSFFRQDYHDVKNLTGKELYTKQISRFSDMTDKELRALFPKVSLPKLSKAEVNPVSKINVELNSSYLDNLKLAKGVQEILDIDKVTGDDLDWRKAKAVSFVKDQGVHCTSGWALASVAAVESLFKIHKGMTLTLSAQEVLNCDFKSKGCSGGKVENALEYMTTGVDINFNVPYTGANMRCKSATRSNKKFEIGSHVFMSGKDILNKSLVISPTVVYLSVHRDLFSYKSGLYDGPCGKAPNHAVLLVGEGFDPETKKRYWVIKNSWGENWGENGFARLVRTDDKFDKCDILTAGYNPSFVKPVVEEKAVEKTKTEKKSGKSAKSTKKSF